MLSELPPLPADVPWFLTRSYMTIVEYDALDRPRFRQVGTAHVPEADRVRLGLGTAEAVTTEFQYDLAPTGNPVGRLTRVVLPFGVVEMRYTAEGWVSSERRQFSIKPWGGATTITDDRTVTQTYNALGAPGRPRWRL